MDQYIYYNWKEYPIPIQYSLPKWINAVEAGLLIDGSIEDEDLLSIFYEWDKRWIIKIEKQGKKISIQQGNWLPDDAKEYEKYMYDTFFSTGSINLIEARILVMDYCFKKWWIENYIPLVQEIYNKRGRLTLLWFLLLPILFFFFTFVVLLIFSIIYTSITWVDHFQISPDIHIHWGGSLFMFLLSLYILIKFLIARFIANRICTKQMKKIQINNTASWAALVAELLWYKKYLDQIRLISKDDSIKEDTLMQYGMADHNIALKTDTTSCTIKSIKKHTCNNIRFLWAYLIRYLNTKRNQTN